MTPYQFGQYIKQAIDMTSPEYTARMRAYSNQMRGQGVKNIQFSPDAKTITDINSKNPVGPVPQRPGSVPATPPAQTKPPVPASRPAVPSPGKPVIRRSRTDF